jgi:hypothetical protein
MASHVGIVSHIGIVEVGDFLGRCAVRGRIAAVIEHVRLCVDSRGHGDGVQAGVRVEVVEREDLWGSGGDTMKTGREMAGELANNERTAPL